MLNHASKGKDLAEKQLLLMGGSPEQQRDFLEHLSPQSARTHNRPQQSSKKAPPPISNKYALGYTYQDVLDADQQDVLARLNIYMLSNPSASFVSLLKPLFTAKMVKDTLIMILLDWSDPLKWARQLRQWVRLMRAVISSLDDEVKVAMEENMNDWKEQRVGPDAPHAQSAAGDGPSAERVSQIPPLGPGEWDEGLGLPLSVVCIQSEKIESLERDFGWQDEHFDFLTQWLRCVLLKHGASLNYTATFDANHVRTLLHSSLSIHSLLKRETAKPNYIERDKILIPPNWDSWGKIRPLREGTDLEAISDAWSVEIQGKPEQDVDTLESISTSQQPQPSETESAVALFEATLPPPSSGTNNLPGSGSEEDSTIPTIQEFLNTQLAILETLKADDEKAARKAASARGPKVSSTGASALGDGAISPGVGSGSARMAERIGPYQINVNGIDFDAEEATRRLKEREAERTAKATADANTAKPAAPSAAAVAGGVAGASRDVASISNMTSGTSTPKRGGTGPAAGAGEDGKASNEAMSAFFQNLIKKDRRAGGGSATGGTTSGNGTPNRVGSPAPGR
jgi:dynein light intermediate chain 1, cytosolic